jgi:hypothetical protein
MQQESGPVETMNPRDPQAPILVRTAPAGRMPGGIAAAVLVLLVVAIAKPWVGAPTESAVTRLAPATPAAPVAATPTAPMAKATPDTADEYCLSQTSWMVAGIMDWGTWTVRTWEAIKPVEATGPLDPAIQFGLIVSPSVWAVGYCAPAGAPSLAGRAVVSAWLIGPDSTATPVALRPWRPEVPTSSLGDLYVETPTRDGSNWQKGRFVFAVADAEGGRAQWFGLDVVDSVRVASQVGSR